MLNNKMVLKIKSIIEKVKNKYNIKNVKCEINCFNNAILTIKSNKRTFKFTIFQDGQSICGITGKDFKEIDINNILN